MSQQLQISNNSANPPLPAFSKNNVPIIFCSNNNYAAYLAVCLKSLIANSSSQNNYDIWILEDNISDKNKQKISAMQTSNISIRFLNINFLLSNLDQYNFAIHGHFTIANYFRLFIPRIFYKYTKVLYLDCDIVIQNDIAKLYHIDLGTNYIAAVKDTGIQSHLYKSQLDKSSYPDYFTQTLEMQNPQDYFNSGIMIMDIQKLAAFDMEIKCFKALQRITPLYVDQCILNNVLQGHVKFLETAWNTQWHLPIFDTDFQKHLADDIAADYLSAYTKPHILHYTSNIKPWNSPQQPMADLWWNYARQTPFYEEIIYKNTYTNIPSKELMRDIFYYRQNRLKYFKYRLLVNFTFGKTRTRYKRKKKELKAKLKSVNQFLKG